MVGFGTCKKGHHLPLLVNNDKVIIIIITSCSQGALHTTIFFFSCVAFVFVLVVLILILILIQSCALEFPQALSPCTCGMKPGLRDHRGATPRWPFSYAYAPLRGCSR